MDIVAKSLWHERQTRGDRRGPPHTPTPVCEGSPSQFICPEGSKKTTSFLRSKIKS